MCTSNVYLTDGPPFRVFLRTVKNLTESPVHSLFQRERLNRADVVDRLHDDLQESESHIS